MGQQQTLPYPFPSSKGQPVENTVENVRCQYDDLCNDGEKSVNKYVCTECSVQSTECGCEGSDAIGQEQTNQEAGLRFSANRSFTQPKG